MLRASVALWSVRVRIAVLACKRPAEPDLSDSEPSASGPSVHTSQLGGGLRPTGVGPGLGRNFKSLPRRVTIIMMMVAGRCPRHIPWQSDGGSDAEWGPDSEPEPATGTGLQHTCHRP